MRHKARLPFLVHGMLRLQSIVRTKMRPPRRPQRLWKASSIACAAVLAVQVLTGTAMAQPTPQPTLAPIINEDVPNRIPGQYIVVFKPGTSREVVLAAQNTVKKFNGRIVHTYTSALIGFSAKLSESALQALRAAPGVAYIEADQKVSINTIWTQPPDPSGTPPTGLDRITQRLLPLDNLYTYDGKGAGVHVYVIDTGIRVTHVEFGGRASWAFDAIGGNVDCHGHGTNVAGIVGASTYGVAKQVNLHAVRVLDCAGNGTVSGGIAGVDWVTNPSNRILPAVANMSLGALALLPTLNTAVTNSILSGVTYILAAGNNNADACTFSPALVPTAVTVGNVNPANDTRWGTSNFGTCLDLFAPGVNILSTGIASDTATSVFTGTSQAAPHVAGVAARYLSSFPGKTPAEVWARIDLMANVFPTTSSWPGIINPGAGSPNKLLHWGAIDDAFDDGDPHITTVRGVHYDFQSAGEFVALRDGNGTQIQMRQTPVATAPPVANPHTGLASCVSLNTAVAARVGAHRVTYQPNLSGVPDPSGLQLRVDGVLKTLGANGLNLGPGGRVVKSSVGDGIEIDFPDGTALTVTPGWWASQSKWYLNVSVFRTPASEGIMGAIAPGSWLPALPNGTSLGPKPAALHQRYVDLNQTFANAWRVTTATSLFDYAPGTSTATFTIDSWPKESPPCVIPQEPSAEPLELQVAERYCREIVGKNRNADCVFDVTVTGEPGFAKTYLLSQQIEVGSTTTTVNDDKNPTQVGDPVTFTATVARRASSGGGVPTGTVQFTLDDSEVGAPVELDSNGRATWKTSSLKVGNHQVATSYIPGESSVFLASSSLDKPHTVVATGQAAAACTKLAFRTAVGAVTIPVGQSKQLGTVDISPFSKIRVVAHERVGSATDVRIRLTLTEGNELVAHLDVLNLTPHSQVTKVYDAPGTKLTIFADALGSGTGSDGVDVLVYGVECCCPAPTRIR